MGSAPSDGTDAGPLTAFKILIAGGFGAGKTTLVGAISEVRPLHTEEPLTRASIGFDDVRGVASKTTTTVAMDFGRITMGGRLVLYLFGTPGQERFWFMWDELSYGALGAVVLADTRRLGDCFPSVDYFEKRQLPFIVAINCFDGAPHYDPQLDLAGPPQRLGGERGQLRLAGAARPVAQRPRQFRCGEHRDPAWHEFAHRARPGLRPGAETVRQRRHRT